MDPQCQTAPRRSKSYPVFHNHLNSRIIQHSPVYSLYTFTQQPNVMGVDRSQRQVQPPRPPNAWILYRSDKIKQLPPLEPGAPRRAQADVSKMISRMWREESEAIKAEYEKRADVKKAEHQARYPNYRFQPMKKSDKDKLREQSKVEKDKDVKKSRRAAPYPSTIPYAPSPQVISSYTIAAPAPVLYSAGLPPTPYLEQIAPSPPLSAASSTPSSPNLFPTLHLDPEAAYTPALQNFPVDLHPLRPHSVPSHLTNRQTSSTSSTAAHTPSLSSYMLPPIILPNQTPSLAGRWPPSTFNWDSQSSPVTWPGTLLHDESPPDLSQDQGLQLTLEEPSQAPTFISLEMPQLPESSQPDIQGWNSGDGSIDFMQAMLSATGDPSIFQVSFDPTMLTSEPPEGFDLSYADLGDPSSSDSWLPTFAPLENGYSNAEGNFTYATDRAGDTSDEISPQQQAEMMQYLNFSYQTTAEDPLPSSTIASSGSVPSPQPNSMPVASSSTYVPPTGALHAGRRVVAGSWKPPGLATDESPPGSPIEHITSPWGVRAVS